MMGKNSFSLLPQLNLLVVAPVNVIKYHYSSNSRGDNHEGSCLIFVRLFSAEQFDKLFVIYEAVFVNVGGSHKLFGF